MKPTISIGIPVHNEAENILFLLKSIVKQQAKSYILENIFVVCDGTTDGTDVVVKEFAKQYPFVQLINDGNRKGKMQRLMEMYRLNTSDFIVLFDGDVVLANNKILDDMVEKFDHENIVIAGANNQPVPGNTLTGKLINQWSHVWYLARLSFNKGDNIHNIRGCGMAMRKDFAKSIEFPPQIVSDAQYIYFYALSKKKKFRFAKSAIVLYRKPNTMHDLLLQSRRSAPEQEKLAPIFGKWVYNKYEIPTKYKILALLKALFENPLLTIMAACFHFYSLKAPHKNSVEKEILWSRPSSTKKPISVSF